MSAHYTPSKSEPFFWSLFSAGGVIAAFTAPVLILVFGILGPMGWLPPETLSQAHLTAVLSHLVVRLFVLVVIALPLFHWAHRFRFVLYDLGIHGGRMAIAVLCYGSALAGSLYSAWLLILSH
jgi:fumarate reductase subunit D